LVLGDKITEGDIIIGLESSGLHSNGYSLARRVLLPKHKLKNSHIFLKSSLGEELLKPTRIYVKPIRDLLDAERESIHGLAHITGGSFSKLSRLSNRVNFNLNKLPQQSGIFNLIQQEGKISHKEMYSTFNMGIGFCIVVSKTRVDKIMEILDRHKLKYYEIGFVTKGTGIVFITIMGRKYRLTD
jgi:phosphoribosylformylglycinamidine cyclo-ligase